MSYGTALQAAPVTPETPPAGRPPRYLLGDLKASLGALERARVLNMSHSGAGIETGQYLKIGQRYPFLFASHSGAVGLTARVAWSRLVKTVSLRRGETRPIFMAGLEFLQVSEAQKQEIGTLLAGLPTAPRAKG